ncbi:MAG: MFS transporter [Gemmatimonadota bacterium]|nr:MFS transporter [Gemmatimonadota bacterium]
MQSPHAPPTSRRALTFIFVTILLDIIGAGIMMPVVPYIVRPYSDDALTIGLMAVAFSVAQFIASPLLGAVSDRHGRRPVLVIGMFGAAIGYALFGIGGALWVYFVSRVVAGFTGGTLTAAQAYIADVSSPEDRSKNFGLVGAAFGLGFVLGPSIGGMLAKISLSAPAWVAGGVALSTAIFGWFALPESLAPERRRAHPLHLGDFNPFRLLMKAVSTAQLRGLFTGIFLSRFAMMSLQTNFAVYTLDRFKYTPAQNAMVFTVLGATATFMQGFLIRRLAGRFSDRTLLLNGLAIMVVGMAAVAAVPVGWMLSPAICILAIGSGLVNPTVQSLVSQAGTAEEQGLLFGANGAITSLTAILGPAWAGAVFDHVAYTAPYWSGAVFLAAGWVAVHRAVRA